MRAVYLGVIMWMSGLGRVRCFVNPSSGYAKNMVRMRSRSTQKESEPSVSEAIRQYTVDGSPRALQVAERRYQAPAASSKIRSSRKSLLESSPVLVLNSDYQPLSYTPLSVWSWQETAKAVFSGRVTVVEEYESQDHVIRSANFAMRLPSVIALRDYRKRNMSPIPHFTRRNVYIRDLFMCQYCNKKFRPSYLTYDHVIPRSKGGPTSWDNVITCCYSCNNRKGDLSTADFYKRHGLKLRKQPYSPSHQELTSKAMRLPLYRNYHETWGNFVVQLQTDNSADTIGQHTQQSSSSSAHEPKLTRSNSSSSSSSPPKKTKHSKAKAKKKSPTRLP